MSNSKTATISLTRAQYEFLRTRYQRNRNVSATSLVKQAVLEIVALQAQKELDEAEKEFGESNEQ